MAFTQAKRLCRSKTDRILGGVCIEAPPAAAPPTPPAPPPSTAKISVVLGVIIVVLGVIFSLFALEIIPWNFWWAFWWSWRRVVGLFWPRLFILVEVLLIAIGIKGH